MMSLEFKSHGSVPVGPCVLWPVDLMLTHLNWNPEATLIHFQGQYLTICELDYNILQGEIQNAPKAPAAVDIGEFCLVEDLTSARWYRGRVQNLKKDLYDVFLIDHGFRSRALDAAFGPKVTSVMKTQKWNRFSTLTRTPICV